jgi:hypothetical protein
MGMSFYQPKDLVGPPGPALPPRRICNCREYLAVVTMERLHWVCGVHGCRSLNGIEAEQVRVTLSEGEADA